MAYKTGCICENGHYVTGSADSEFASPFCPKCGAKTITACPACSIKIRGTHEGSWGSVDPVTPPHCYGCGAPYALRANTTHGKPLSQRDRAAALRAFCDAGLHLDSAGGRTPPPSPSEIVGVLFSSGLTPA